MSESRNYQARRLRGVVLELINTNHAEQRSRIDAVALWGLLISLGYGVGQNDVLTVLQDLRDRTYLVFGEKQNRLTNRTEITQIQITALGRDVVEGTREDPSILIP